MTDRPLTTGEGNTASHLHPHEPEQPPLLDADGRCFVCALSVSQDECDRLREQLDAARQALARQMWIVDALDKGADSDEAAEQWDRRSGCGWNGGGGAVGQAEWVRLERLVTPAGFEREQELVRGRSFPAAAGDGQP